MRHHRQNNNLSYSSTVARKVCKLTRSLLLHRYEYTSSPRSLTCVTMPTANSVRINLLSDVCNSTITGTLLSAGQSPSNAAVSRGSSIIDIIQYDATALHSQGIYDTFVVKIEIRQLLPQWYTGRLVALALLVEGTYSTNSFKDAAKDLTRTRNCDHSRSSVTTIPSTTSPSVYHSMPSKAKAHISTQ